MDLGLASVVPSKLGSALAAPKSEHYNYLMLMLITKLFFMMDKTGIRFCSVKKIGKVFRIKTQTGQSAMFFCVLGKRERFLVEETQTVLPSS